MSRSHPRSPSKLSTTTTVKVEPFFYDVTIHDIVPVSAVFVQSAIQMALEDLYGDSYPGHDVKVDVVRWHTNTAEGITVDDDVALSGH